MVDLLMTLFLHLCYFFVLYLYHLLAQISRLPNIPDKLFVGWTS
jgi:hypothetical protein